MIKCYIIDDEHLAIKVIEKYIEQIPDLELVGSSTNPVKGIVEIKKNNVDVVFLDIRMDEMSGLEVMEIVNPNTKVVFCTAYSEFAIKSYELDAIDYLMKPIAFSRFLRAIERVKRSLSKEIYTEIDIIPNDYIFVKAEQKGKLLKIDLDDIDYVEGMSNYVAFHRGKQKTLTYLTMREVEDRLPSNSFIRVHKSFIVAIKQIISLENNEIILKNRTDRIPLGSSYKESFLQKMKNKLLF